jgi:hypothetical protein
MYIPNTISNLYLMPAGGHIHRKKREQQKVILYVD